MRHINDKKKKKKKNGVDAAQLRPNLFRTGDLLCPLERWLDGYQDPQPLMCIEKEKNSQSSYRKLILQSSPELPGLSMMVVVVSTLKKSKCL